MRMKLWAATAAITLATGGVLANGLGASAASGSSTQYGWSTAIGSGASATAAPAPPALRLTAGRTIKLVGHGTNGKGVNVDGPGFGPGDYFLFTEKLRNRDTGKEVGRDSVTCMVGFHMLFMCHGTFFLQQQGTIEVSGTLSPTSQVIAVTGGTENFQNVRGELHVGGGNQTNLTLHLIP